ncbi:hypothetical protein FDP41_002231 [Naegleria fowleri]|uniref:Uncharacterized protein n=1 Tax=Naegleria fowleri TaxID=5763 RepID=A0A6A5BVG8_NAEFO|nr:uncharacterized protein FDP41_002231 [Naegleria fowleri]KAF0978411.1 hypothetical protein FDP41_002231 [Naegleria fowleri]CAG4714729.1 unnamed protein product [Naegleria fowleri]
MLHLLDPLSLEMIFLFCTSDELIALYGTNRKITKAIDILETDHMKYDDSENPNINDETIQQTLTDTHILHDGLFGDRSPQTYMPFRRKTSTTQRVATQYRLQIYHPSYTIYIRFDSHEELRRKCIQDFQEKFGFKQMDVSANHLIVLESEILKSDLLDRVRSELRKKMNLYESMNETHKEGLNVVIESEYNPYSMNTKPYLSNFYERYTIRLVIVKNQLEFGHFLSCAQQLVISTKTSWNYLKVPSIYLGLLKSDSDLLIAAGHLFPGVPKEYDTTTICELTLCLILNHLMPKYFFEKYRVCDTKLELFQKQALVDTFYNEFLNSPITNTKQKSLPIFESNNYFDSRFSLFKHGLEVCFDLIYNQLSLTKKIQLIEKLVDTFLVCSSFTNSQLTEIAKHTTFDVFKKRSYETSPEKFLFLKKLKHSPYIELYVIHVEEKVYFEKETKRSDHYLYELCMKIPAKLNGNCVCDIVFVRNKILQSSHVVSIVSTPGMTLTQRSCSLL